MAKQSDTKSLIALLTDFGTTDTYVGSLKAALFKVNPDASVVDLCHYIRPQNIQQGAFVLRMVYRDYPAGTIFVCVVDPGVGGKRLPIAVEAGSYYFVGPDNGLFSYIYAQEKISNVVVLTNEKLWQHPVSSTFHGRDIFAPCGAWLSKNKKFSELGTALDGEPCKLTLPVAALTEDDTFEGQVLHIDRFGNLITNIHRDDFQAAKKKLGKNSVELSVADWCFPFANTYENASQESLVGLWGSTGFLELSARNGSAREILDCDLKEPVSIHFRNAGS